MCEQMGWEPRDEDIPMDPAYLSIEAQQALIVLNALPDLWDGMGGNWLGKDYSGLAAVLEIYEVEDSKRVFELLKISEVELGKYYSQKRKEQESMSKAKRAG